MEIKSSLLNNKDLKLLKDSLIAASEVDGKENFRVRLIEYIDDTADNEDDEFFYDMIEFCRFLIPDNETTAYTTPDHIIYLNAPGVFGEKVREWDFVYCHECLHQLWETFEVAEQIQKNGVKYDHYVLNIASDCVINDYLAAIRKKTAPPQGITPEYLNKTYGIDYDRKVDTQYTLYLKLLEVAEQLRQDQICQDAQDSNDGQGQEGQSSSSSNNSSASNSSNSSSGGGSSSDKNDSQSNTAEDAQKSADEAKDAADKAQQNADSGKGSQEDANAAKDAAKDAQAAADKAKDAADKGDKDGEARAAQEAKDAADKAKKLAGETGDKDNTDRTDGNGKDSKEGNKDNTNRTDGNGKDSKAGSKGQGHEGSSDDNGTSGEMTEEEKAQIKAKAESVIKKYKEKISGVFGDFVKKCKNSVKCDPNGLASNTPKGKGSWNKQMDLAINAYVKKNLDKKRRQFEQTYKRIKRGSGFVKMGAPIIPGKRIKDNKMPINIAYYIDRSGSMGGCIDQVFEAAFKISEALKQRFKKDKFVDSIDFRTFVFNDEMEEIKFGQKRGASGGTMSFDGILDFINKNTKNVLINIIITDADFDVNDTKVKKFLKEGVDGLVIFVTNNANDNVKKIADEIDFKTKLVYILADANFNVD